MAQIAGVAPTKKFHARRTNLRPRTHLECIEVGKAKHNGPAAITRTISVIVVAVGRHCCGCRGHLVAPRRSQRRVNGGHAGGCQKDVTGIRHPCPRGNARLQFPVGLVVVVVDVAVHVATGNTLCFCRRILFRKRRVANVGCATGPPRDPLTFGKWHPQLPQGAFGASRRHHFARVLPVGLGLGSRNGFGGKEDGVDRGSGGRGWQGHAANAGGAVVVVAVTAVLVLGIRFGSCRSNRILLNPGIVGLVTIFVFQGLLQKGLTARRGGLGRQQQAVLFFLSLFVSIVLHRPIHQLHDVGVVDKAGISREERLGDGRVAFFVPHDRTPGRQRDAASVLVGGQRRAQRLGAAVTIRETGGSKFVQRRSGCRRILHLLCAWLEKKQPQPQRGFQRFLFSRAGLEYGTCTPPVPAGCSLCDLLTRKEENMLRSVLVVVCY